MAMSDDVKQIYDLFGPTVAKLNDAAIRIGQTADENRILLVGKDGNNGVFKRLDEAASAMMMMHDRWDKYLETRAQTCPIGRTTEGAIDALRKQITDRAVEIREAQKLKIESRTKILIAIIGPVLIGFGAALKEIINLIW